MLAAFKFTGASLRIFGLDLSQHPFTTGGRQLLFPGVLRNEAFAWAGAAGIRAVRGSVPDQMQLRGRPAAPQRAEDPAHDAVRGACSSSPRRWRTWT